MVTNREVPPPQRWSLQRGPTTQRWSLQRGPPVRNLTLPLSLSPDCDHINPSTCESCSGAIDNLIDAFTESVSEYLTGESAQSDSSSYAPPTKELAPQRKGLERANIRGFSKSHDNLVSKFNSYSTSNLSQQFNDSSKQFVCVFVCVCVRPLPLLFESNQFHPSLLSLCACHVIIM